MLCELVANRLRQQIGSNAFTMQRNVYRSYTFTVPLNYRDSRAAGSGPGARACAWSGSATSRRAWA